MSALSVSIILLAVCMVLDTFIAYFIWKDVKEIQAILLFYGQKIPTSLNIEIPEMKAPDSNNSHVTVFNSAIKE